ncbi:Crp/Fnr family transcriptional regulator [Runella sp. MFBS21]|uniref:Crp/Fnr family transcriptional regulator n=1 Tax=Runella sp. MFBS21 TaxID=3034018 RepID=UPI0023FA4104|nr:Crp/Fnr family transcriptional regulator [Runella sp. MFBS21]MDF7816947.1 Crp/Fnr family transcriptional regulator [Runella sp. MFBS21]
MSHLDSISSFEAHLCQTQDENFVTALLHYGPLRDTCQKSIAACLTESNLPAQSLVFRESQANAHIYWIKSGTVRFFQQQPDGEKTTGFAPTGMFFCALSSLLSKKPALESCITEEATTLQGIRYDDWQQLIGQYPELKAVFDNLCRHWLETTHERNLLLHQSNPQKRYEFFLKLYHQATYRLKVKHIASYLGIHRVTLCKIRARLAKKKT